MPLSLEPGSMVPVVSRAGGAPDAAPKDAADTSSLDTAMLEFPLEEMVNAAAPLLEVEEDF